MEITFCTEKSSVSTILNIICTCFLPYLFYFSVQTVCSSLVLTILSREFLCIVQQHFTGFDMWEFHGRFWICFHYILKSIFTDEYILRVFCKYPKTCLLLFFWFLSYSVVRWYGLFANNPLQFVKTCFLMVNFY